LADLLEGPLSIFFQLSISVKFLLKEALPSSALEAGLNAVQLGAALVVKQIRKQQQRVLASAAMI